MKIPSKILYSYLLSAPAIFLLVGLLVCPLVLVLRVSLYQASSGHGFFTPGTWTLANHEIVLDRYGLGIMGYTLGFGVVVSGLVLLIGFPLALFLRSLVFPWRQGAIVGITLSKFASVLVILFGLQQLLGDSGPLNRLMMSMGVISEPFHFVRGFFGSLVGEVFLILPYAVILLFVQLLEIDPVLESTARGLGASGWQVFCRVTFPLCLPGLLLAGQLSLIWGWGAFLGPLLLGGPENTTVSVEIHRQAFEYGRWPRAAALSVQLMIAMGLGLGLFSLARRFARRSA